MNQSFTYLNVFKTLPTIADSLFSRFDLFVSLFFSSVYIFIF